MQQFPHGVNGGDYYADDGYDDCCHDDDGDDLLGPIAISQAGRVLYPEARLRKVPGQGLIKIQVHVFHFRHSLRFGPSLILLSQDGAYQMLV